MLPAVHAEITRRALDQSFSPNALKIIIAANLRLDAPLNQIGHDEYHFDNNAFEKSRLYLEEQRSLIQPALGSKQVLAAWRAFGRLTHTAQDFYAHSNYVALWLASHPAGLVPEPSEIDPLDDSLAGYSSLESGKSYFPLGFLSFVPGLGGAVTRLLPHDSHAAMNLDSPARGPLFEYAFHAALKRTKHEFNIVARSLTKELNRQFADL